MVGIKSYGVYIPWYRLNTEILAQEWDKRLPKTKKAVANYDEDSLTMAVNSSSNCINNSKITNQKIDSLFFASTTMPYKEKQCSTIIATALDLKKRIRTLDISSSIRGSTCAIIQAIDSVKSDSTSNIIVVGSDIRLPEPGSDLEPLFGDASGAVLLGNENIIAEITKTCTITDDFLDYWQKNQDKYIKSDDIRYATNYGYIKNMSEIINDILEKTDMKLQDFSKIVLSPFSFRSHKAISRKFKIPPEILQAPLLEYIGWTGTAHPLIMLISALENSKPNDKILFTAYGDGCDAFILEVTEEIKKIQEKQCLKKSLENFEQLSSYAKYLSFRKMIKEQMESSTPFSSVIMYNREKSLNIRLIAKKCKKCNTINTLNLRVCPHCKTKDNFEDFKLCKKGKIVTYSQEYYYPKIEPPVTMAVIDLDDGGRITLQMTDEKQKEVKIGMKVELTFRKMHSGSGFYNYNWKAKPIRGLK